MKSLTARAQKKPIGNICRCHKQREGTFIIGIICFWDWFQKCKRRFIWNLSNCQDSVTDISREAACQNLTPEKNVTFEAGRQNVRNLQKKHPQVAASCLQGHLESGEKGDRGVEHSCVNVNLRVTVKVLPIMFQNCICFKFFYLYPQSQIIFCLLSIRLTGTFVSNCRSNLS